MSKLIVYFSRKGENYVSGTLKNLEIGNTEAVAYMIKKFIDADLFQIEMLMPYSKNYNESTSQAQLDQRRNARPELKKYPENINIYDTIYLGYPNYWGTMPMVVFTFLEHFDFSGKTIRPFCTHEGSGLGSSVNDIKRLCPGANVENGIAVHGSRIEKSINDIKKWI